MSQSPGKHEKCTSKTSTRVRPVRKGIVLVIMMSERVFAERLSLESLQKQHIS